MAPACSKRAAHKPAVDPHTFAARAIRRALYLPLVLTAFLAAALMLQVLRLRSDMVAAKHINHAMVLEREAYRLIIDAVASLRGYLLTDDRSFLDQGERARDELPPVLSQLEREGPRAGVAADAARELADDAERWFAFRQRIVAEHEAGRDAAATQLEGRSLLDGIRSQRRARSDELRRERDVRETRAHTAIEETLLAIAVLALALGAGIARYVRRDLIALANAYTGALTLATRARDQAEEVSRLKDEFLRTISHELRTPLTAILGWTALLRRRTDPETLRRSLDTIDRKTQGLGRIVDDMLDVSRIVTGELRLRVEPAAEAKGIAVQVDVDPAARSMRADPGRLQQVLWNLVGNAVKFTPQGGHVHVRARRVEGDVDIRVSDTGPGIPPARQAHLFERFGPGDASSTRTHGGIGMGLAIVRHVVELHGGTVRVESPGEEGGATFVVTLPAAEEP
jgi:signal transduction histidine kinase